MDVYRIEVRPRDRSGHFAADHHLTALLRDAGLPDLGAVRRSRLYLLEGELSRDHAARIAAELLADPVAETWLLCGPGDPLPQPESGVAIEVHPRPGVMDPVAETTLTELRAEGYAVRHVRTAWRYELQTAADPQRVLETIAREIANDCIERLVLGSAPLEPAPQPPVYELTLRHVPLRDLDAAGLERLSREGHLFLSLDEMRAIQEHYRRLGREPTDLELETLAQTWSEHCVHKTLKAEVTYRGPAMARRSGEVELHYDNLLRDTIARATQRLMAADRGPQCLSVFDDNAGIIAFDDEYGLAFKVETHNHPSAIEPYGGAATGIGGCIRDILGCGLGARPVANTDVFCVAPVDWPRQRLPKGVLHPRRVLRGVVDGVGDYGNRMGIPTVNGAVCCDPRYLGNPLVYCGCAGLIPRHLISKAARPGDLIVLIGGRTGRDGIHGATFSSAELTDTHADEFSHAVQIGNAITEKRVLDALLKARDCADGCLYSAVTDCGAGGLSSAVGEMGRAVGAVVDLERVPLKYAGLRYDEIWISEAQERMVLAVPPERLERLLAVMAAEEVEASVIGEFGHESDGRPALLVRYQGQEVGRLEMDFLHEGLPRRRLLATWQPPDHAPPAPRVPEARDTAQLFDRLLAVLADTTIAGKEWIIRRYDHEVQGGSVIKPLAGPGGGPADAAVIRPRLDSCRGVAIGCGLAPELSDYDPYWAALAAVDEALRNVVSVGGDPQRCAVLDNFCWGRCDEPQQLGGLVRACQGCHDAAVAYGVPFISGKDSLNNEFALREEDVEPLIELLGEYARRSPASFPDPQAVWLRTAERIRRTRRLAIPGTLLISAVSLIDDVRRCISPDLKQPGNRLLLVGALPRVDFEPAQAAAIHTALARAISEDLIAACHDVSDGGWLVSVAEMLIAAIACGVRLTASWSQTPPPLEPLTAGYVVETADAARVAELLGQAGAPVIELGEVTDQPALTAGDRELTRRRLRAAWAP